MKNKSLSQLIIILVINLSASRETSGDFVTNSGQDLNRTTPQLIESRNFVSETHLITTSDGYILKLFRIINPYLNTSAKHLKPILIQHGFTANSDEFLVAREGYLSANGVYSEEEEQKITDCVRNFGKTIGFVLSACAYDVWLSNVRGNKYSTNHSTLDTNDSEFWKFSMDEMSLIDLPAIIQYILGHTKRPKLGYIGYSMGTTLMFALLSDKPEYSHIIDPFIALAPVVYVSKVPNFFLRFKNMHPFLRAIPMPLFRFEILRTFFVDLFSRHELSEQNSYISQLAAHLIDESSTLVLSHYLQMMSNNNFAKYDYGLFENYRRYGKPKAPDYSVANITSKRIALIQSKEKDLLSDQNDIQRLKRELNVQLLMDYYIPDRNWTHTDFLFNRKLDEYVVSIVLHLLTI